MTSQRKVKALPNKPTPAFRKKTVAGGLFMRVAVVTKTGKLLEISNNLAFECKPDASPKVKRIAHNTAQIARLIEERSTASTPWYPTIKIIDLHDTRKLDVAEEETATEDDDI